MLNAIQNKDAYGIVPIHALQPGQIVVDINGTPSLRLVENILWPNSVGQHVEGANKRHMSPGAIDVTFHNGTKTTDLWAEGVQPAYLMLGQVPADEADMTAARRAIGNGANFTLTREMTDAIPAEMVEDMLHFAGKNLEEFEGTLVDPDNLTVEIEGKTFKLDLPQTRADNLQAAIKHWGRDEILKQGQKIWVTGYLVEKQLGEVEIFAADITVPTPDEESDEPVVIGGLPFEGAYD